MWGEELIEGDVQHARLGLAAAVEFWWQEQGPATRARLQAFSDGINSACAENSSLGATRREVLPVGPRDVVARTFSMFFEFSRFWDQGLAFPRVGGPGLLGGGSSAWAVGAEKSSTGEGLLLINPHIPWIDPYRMFEARILFPERSCHGATPIGLPWQSFAYTQHVGWTHTVNPLLQLWVYELDVTGGRYLHDGGHVPFETHVHLVIVRGGDPVSVTERRSLHGPVIEAPDGTLVAIRVAGVLHQPVTTALECWWQMSLAETVEELFDVEERWRLPMFNILAADSSGSVGAAFFGATPTCPGGSFDDSRRRPCPATALPSSGPA